MQQVETDSAPAAVGAYSQATKTGDLIFTAGQIGLHPVTGELEDDSFTSETAQALKNLLSIVEAGGSNSESVLKVTVYLTTIDTYDSFNDVYMDLFDEPFPARSVVAVDELPRNARLEVEAVANVNPHNS